MENQEFDYNDLRERILALADLLPTGRDDPRAEEKLRAERGEFSEAFRAWDTSCARKWGLLTSEFFAEAVLEAADRVYYAAKISVEALRKELVDVSDVLSIDEETVIAVLFVKLQSRARPGNPKSREYELELARTALLYNL